MSNRDDGRHTDAATDVSAALLAEWGLPDPGGDKKARGDVLVVGGSRRTPGGVILAGEAALRVGAGRLAVLVPQSIDAQLGAVLPEAAIYALPDDVSEPLEQPIAESIAEAGAVLVGPGFDNADETRGTLIAVADAGPTRLVLDAYALGVLPSIDRAWLPAELVLTPNREELALLLERDEVADLEEAVRDAASRYDAVVSCYGVVSAPDGEMWRVGEGGPTLATSGSGDVLSGAIAGFVARGVDLAHAAVWGTWAHARAGDRLAERLGLGVLAREVVAELPLAVIDAEQG